MYELTLLLPAGTVTFPEAGTTIDLVWGNKKAEERLINCQIARDNDHASDHLPIETTLNLSRELKNDTQPPYNFTKTE